MTIAVYPQMTRLNAAAVNCSINICKGFRFFHITIPDTGEAIVELLYHDVKNHMQQLL